MEISDPTLIGIGTVVSGAVVKASYEVTKAAVAGIKAIVARAIALMDTLEKDSTEVKKELALLREGALRSAGSIEKSSVSIDRIGELVSQRTHDLECRVSIVEKTLETMDLPGRPGR